MPIYEYSCNNCGTESDILVKNTQNMSINCPKCNSQDMTKLISLPGAVMTKSAAPPPMPACPQKGKCGGGQCPMNS